MNEDAQYLQAQAQALQHRHTSRSAGGGVAVLRPDVSRQRSSNGSCAPITEDDDEAGSELPLPRRPRFGTKLRRTCNYSSTSGHRWRPN